VINDINADIVVLLEAWTWQADDHLAKFSQITNYPYRFLSPSNTKHCLGLLSKIKPNRTDSLNQNMHHSILKAEFPFENQNFTIIGIHLSPGAENQRLAEIKKIITLAKQENNPIVIGDFNSLSPEDEYDEKELLAILKQKKITKFGDTPLKWTVITAMLNAGFIDIGKKYAQLPIEYSVPTESNTDIDHFTKIRLDYAFTTREFEKQIVDTKILRDEITEQASDHFPLLLTLK